MMKYELENFWRGFLGEIEIIIELDDGKEIPVGTSEAEYYMDAHGTGHVKLIPGSILTRKQIGYTKTGPDGQMEKIEITVKTENVCSVLKKLIDFIEKYNIEDEGSDDGGGHYDTWRSHAFDQLIEKAKEVIGC